jgi:hypothetical protein
MFYRFLSRCTAVFSFLAGLLVAGGMWWKY